jgi:hypothetical protein
LVLNRSPETTLIGPNAFPSHDKPLRLRLTIIAQTRLTEEKSEISEAHNSKILYPRPTEVKLVIQDVSANSAASSKKAQKEFPNYRDSSVGFKFLFVLSGKPNR